MSSKCEEISLGMYMKVKCLNMTAGDDIYLFESFITISFTKGYHSIFNYELTKQLSSPYLVIFFSHFLYRVSLFHLSVQTEVKLQEMTRPFTD